MESDYKSPEQLKRFEGANAAIDEGFHNEHVVKREFDGFYEKYKNLPQEFANLEYVKKREKRMITSYLAYVNYGEEKASLSQVLTDHLRYYEAMQETMESIKANAEKIGAEAEKLRKEACACISGKA